MRTDTDKSGNTFFEVGNVRITAVPSTWDGSPGIRVQAKKGKGDSLHQGAELPIPDKETAYDFLRALHAALDENDL